MNKNEKLSIKKYDSIANVYDKTFDGKLTAKFKKKILELCEVLAGDKVLDVGCGNGSLIYANSKSKENENNLLIIFKGRMIFINDIFPQFDVRYCYAELFRKP